MEKTLLDEFNEYTKITNKTYTVDKLNSLSTTNILLLILNNEQNIANLKGLKNIIEYNQRYWIK